GHVDTLGEALLVAQEHGDVVPLVDADVDDGLSVRIGEHRVGELLEQCGGHLVGGGRRLVNFFTSVVVVVRHRAARRRSPGDGNAVALVALDVGAAALGAGATPHDLAGFDLVVQGEDPVHQRLRAGRA